MRLYTLKDVSNITGYSLPTIRSWVYSGKLKTIKSKGGHHRVTEELLDELLGAVKPKKQDKISIGYCRVSSNKQKDDLVRQVDNVKQYMIAKGYSFDIISDIGSGINYKNKGLISLVNMVINNQVDKVVLLYKDRLVRFGFELIEALCRRYGTEIEIIDNTEKPEEQELVEDLIQIVTVFSCRLQGKRAHKAKKFIKDVITND